MKVEIYKLVNRLKLRMGVRFEKYASGFLDEKTIAEADDLIAKVCATSPQILGQHIESLAALWMETRNKPISPERNEATQKIFMLAHEIKDLGSMCGYDLLAHFAESLRDYIGRTDLNLNAQIVIIQAHIDAMQSVHRLGVKSEAGPEAEELKKMVKMAVEKYQ